VENKISVLLVQWNILFEELLFLLKIRELENTCAKFGTWSLKDLVSHILAWDIEILRQYNLFKNGYTEIIEHEIEAFNKNAIEDRMNNSLKENIADLKKTNDQINIVLSSLSSLDYKKNSHYEEWLEIEISHYSHHIKQIKQQLPNAK